MHVRRSFAGWRIAFVLAAAWVATAAPQMAAAQTRFDVPLPLNYVDPAAGALAEAAFSQPYGRLLAAEFATVIGESADPQCRTTAAATKDQIAERARGILQRRGRQMFEKIGDIYDRTMLFAKLVADGVPNADDERRRLRNDPAVRRYVAMAQPMVLAGAAGLVVENVDRYALILRIKLARPIGPMASGDEKLLRADPSDEISEKLEAYITASTSPALQRYLELTDLVQRALNQSYSREMALKSGPIQWLTGLDTDLAALCVTGP